MKKLLLGIVTVMLVFAMILPVSVNAATITADKSEMEVGDIVTLKVTTNPAESIQFDLLYDSNKYRFITATSDLDATGSNVIETGIVRVSAFDRNGGEAEEVVLQFEATNPGKATPFSVIKDSEEIVAKDGSKETFAQLTIDTIQINGEEVAENEESEFIGEDGKPIKRLPQTGGKEAIRMYDQLLNNTERVVAYALPNSDTTLDETAIKAQFGQEVVINDVDGNGILGTGETFSIKGQNYTVVIYGDVNGDGRVTTLDALTTRKVETGKLTTNEANEEALDVVKVNDQGKNDPNHEMNALAQQDFILRRHSNTINKTILDEYPEKESMTEIEGLDANTTVQGTNAYRYEKLPLAELTSTNAEVIGDEKALTYEIEIENVDKKDIDVEVTYESKGNGIYTMSLYTAHTGKHTITPIIMGANVNGGVLKGEPITIEISDNNEITNVLFLDEEGNEISSSSVKSGSKTNEIRVSFVHEYKDAQGKTIDTVEVPVTESSAVVVKSGDLTDDNTTLTWITDNGKITGLNVVTTASVGKTGGITVSTGSISSKNLTVYVAEKTKTVGINLNGTELSHTVREVKPIVLRKNDYIILPIELRDEEGNTSKITMGDIVKTGYELTDDEIDGKTEQEIASVVKSKDDAMFGKMVIYETADEYYGTLDVDIQGFKWENDTYVQKPLADENGKPIVIDAIGIKLADQPDLIENLKDGLTIVYDTINGRQSARIPISAAYDENDNELLSQISDFMTDENTSNLGQDLDHVDPVIPPQTNNDMPEDENNLPTEMPEEENAGDLSDPEPEEEDEITGQEPEDESSEEEGDDLEEGNSSQEESDSNTSEGTNSDNIGNENTNNVESNSNDNPKNDPNILRP